VYLPHGRSSKTRSRRTFSCSDTANTARAGGASSETSYTTLRTIIALPAVHLPAAVAHRELTGIVLAIQADRARVLQAGVSPTRGTHRITASATATLFPTDFLVSADFPMGFLTLHAAVVHTLAPPATLHRAKTTCLLAVGAHQPTRNPGTLLGPRLPTSSTLLRHRRNVKSGLP
jgi:hypothetical protein